MNNMRAFVRYDSKGIVVPASFVMKKSKPKVGNWLEISTTKSTVNPPDGSSLGNLRAFVRYNAQNRIVPGSVVVRSQVPQSGNWGEITYSTARPISGSAPLILQYTITAPATQISIPLGSSAYSFEADWGDGTTTGPLESADGTLLNPQMVHTYADPGVYNITISGSAFPYFNLYSSPDAATKTQLTNIVQWGSFNWESFVETFRGCTALTSVGSGKAPILTLTTSLESMFNGCTAITDWSNLATWNTSAVTSLEDTFRSSSFNDAAGTYISGWNVSNVTTLYGLFANTSLTTIDLSGWNTSNVTDMSSMFGGSASLATANLSGWDVSNVTNMNFMFAATAIGTVNGIEDWQISQVTNFGDFMLLCPGLSTPVYDQLLVNWDAQGAMSYAGTVDFGCSVYTEAWTPGAPGAEASRTSLIAKWGGINDCGGTPDVTGFIIEVDTEGDGLAPGDQTYIVYTNPGVFGVSYDYNVETSDGQTITGNTSNTTITFPSPGIYKIKITGTFPSYYSGTTSNQNKIKDVIAWGPNLWTSFYRSFYVARRLVSITATDTPNLSNVTDMRDAFESAERLVSINNLGSWDVSGVTQMQSMFKFALDFNDVGITSWNTASVQRIDEMFYNATDFNQDISGWDVSNVWNMNSTFRDADSFNQPIGAWNTSNVSNTSEMFRNANIFNQDLSGWDMSNINSAAWMFRDAFLFNSPLNGWSFGLNASLLGMFQEANSFNQDLSSWNVSNVTSMQNMFYGANVFNNGGSPNINNWDVSNVTNMSGMFRNTTAFNHPLGDWNISNVTNFTNFMTGKTAANYSAANLDDIYSKWSLLTVSPNESISFGTIQYTIAGGQAGRNILTGAPNNWTITDGGGI